MFALQPRRGIPPAIPPGAAIATTGGTGSGEPDMVLVGELLEEISRNPPAISARKVLVEHYISVGWLDAAMEDAKELNRLTPGDPDVTGFLDIFSRRPEPPLGRAPSQAAVKPELSSSGPRSSPTSTWRAPAKRKPLGHAPVKLPKNLDSTRQDFSQGYQSLREKAKFHLVNLLHLQNLQKKNGMPPSKNTPRIEALVEGRDTDKIEKAHPPGSARMVARSMQADPEKANQLAIVDLEATVRWLRELHGKPSGVDDDTVRDALVKRVQALKSILPESLKLQPEIALMHAEHESLKRNYVNGETMLGDRVVDIPRENFWVTEDNYAWDMGELVQAITANGGVMRNPLSRQMFTAKDIQGIISHPQGKGLAALQVEQHEMSKGVRPDTIEHLEKLAKILLEDQTSDSLPSRHAVDEFMAYCATLPEIEQKALDGLRCPAKDSHTGQSYDFSIGEAVRDAKGNRVCFHKTGDFIKQAAAHLRQNRGAPSYPDRCLVM